LKKVLPSVKKSDILVVLLQEKAFKKSTLKKTLKKIKKMLDLKKLKCYIIVVPFEGTE